MKVWYSNRFCCTAMFMVVALLGMSWVDALEDGFVEQQIIRGKSFMTDFRFTPDGSHMFVAQKDGQVLVYEDVSVDDSSSNSIEWGNEMEALDIESKICHNGERGLGGMVFHSQFGKDNRWIYLYYTFRKYGNCNEFSSRAPVNRLARYNVTDEWKIDFSDSEVIFFDTPVTEERVHNGGSLNFGRDNYLYITTGDGGSRKNSGEISNLHGGIIRLTDNNEIPPSNPFFGQPGAVRCSPGSDTTDYSNLHFEHNDVTDETNTNTLDPLPPILFVGDNSNPAEAFPLNLCEGDCDKDSDCSGALVCVQRAGQEMVGGCGLPGLNTEGRDVCATVDANQNTAGTNDAKKCLELYAVGLRNPFRLSMNPNVEKTEFMVNDVGAELWEEMTLGGDDYANGKYEKGLQNFGWPTFEGPCRPNKQNNCEDPQRNGAFRPPFHFYKHRDGGAAVSGTFIPNGIWPAEYDNGYLFGEFVHGRIYLVQGGDDTNCHECNPPESRKEVSRFLDYPGVINMRFGPYSRDCKQALYYSSAKNSGVMRRVVYTGNGCDEQVETGSNLRPAVANSSTTTRPESPAPSALVGDGEGGYPSELLPWNQECDDGIDYCGVIEFCNDKSTGTFAYRLPCQDQICPCTGMSGPLIRLRVGNKYKLVLRNVADGDISTNLHTHGLHIVGSGNSDDVVRQASGGNCLDYVWDIATDHPGGTYWYHAHHHGHTEEQVLGGAFGLLIVEDNLYLNPDTPVWLVNERLLQIFYSDNDYMVYGNRRTNEAIDILPLYWYRLRVSTVDSDGISRNLTFHDEKGLCLVHKIASDGVWRSSVPGPSSLVFELTGASRADFAIQCRGEMIWHEPYHVPVTYGDLHAATVRISPSQSSGTNILKQWKPRRPYALQDLRNLTVPDDNNLEIKLGYDYVNGRKWDPKTPLATIDYNSVHEWVLHQTAKHPFHIHLYHMQVVKPGGCGAHEEGEWYDTISAPGNCTVRFFTADFGQRCVLHCHVYFHEDNGSMSWVNVTGEGMPLNTVSSPQYQCPAQEIMVPTATIDPTDVPSAVATYTETQEKTLVPSESLTTGLTLSTSQTGQPTDSATAFVSSFIPTAEPATSPLVTVSKSSSLADQALDNQHETELQQRSSSAHFPSASFSILCCFTFSLAAFS